jgi:hypothetical protein
VVQGRQGSEEVIRLVAEMREPQSLVECRCFDLVPDSDIVT